MVLTDAPCVLVSDLLQLPRLDAGNDARKDGKWSHVTLSKVFGHVFGRTVVRYGDKRDVHLNQLVACLRQDN